VSSRLTWARRARADDVNDASSVTTRPEIAVAVGGSRENVVATMHWTRGWLQWQRCITTISTWPQLSTAILTDYICVMMTAMRQRSKQWRHAVLREGASLDKFDWVFYLSVTVTVPPPLSLLPSPATLSQKRWITVFLNVSKKYIIFSLKNLGPWYLGGPWTLSTLDSYYATGCQR